MKMKNRRRRRSPLMAVALGLAMIAAACGQAAPPDPVVVTVTVPGEPVVVTVPGEQVVVTVPSIVTETETVTETVVVTSIVTQTETVEVMVEGPDQAELRTLRVAIPDDVEHLDPAFGQAQLTNLVLKNVYMQPVQYRPGPSQGRFAYADTTSFEGQWVEAWDFSDDRKTITLTLRQGLVFPASGNRVTSDDVIYTIERAIGTASGPAWVWGNIGVTSLDQIERVDERTVVINNARPSSIVLPLMRDQTMGLLDGDAISSWATDDDPWATAWMSQNYAGNGRYVVDSWDRGSRMVLKSNPTWPGRQPYFETVELLVVPESANRLALLQNGEVDIAMDLSTQEMEIAEGSDGVDVLGIPDRNAMNVLLNTQQAPFDNVDLRKALAYATDYNAIVEGVLNGRAVPSEGPISVNSRFFDMYELGESWNYEHDPDKAREHLAAAGAPDGFEFEMIISQNLPVGDAIAANLKANYADVGIDMTIRPVSGAEMFESLAGLSHQAAFRGGLLDYIDDPYYHFYLWWLTDTVINWTGFTNERVDEIVLETAELIDDQTRREPYREAVGLVVDAAPMLWLANADFTLAVREDISGYTHHPDGLLWFATLERTG